MLNLIKTYIHGGLGNQLFQYAATKSLKAINSNYQTRFFFIDELWSKNSVNLDFFINIKNKNQIDKKKISERIYDKLTSLFYSYNINDYYSTINLNDIPKKKSYILNGYFQNKSWYLQSLKEVTDEILNKSKKKILDKFPENEMVIAIRRSDYTKLGWELNLNYYWQSIKILNPNKKKKITLISEDDQFLNLFYEKLKKQGYRTKPARINSRFPKSVSDFCHLIKSENLIIANSSFSWWAAAIRSKLNYNNSDVIIPKNWYPKKLKLLKNSHPGNPYKWREIINLFI
jgi:hypothetical protein